MHFLHYISQNIHSHLFFSNLLYMPLGGKWQTILLELISNSKLYKTYSHLKVISLVFWHYNSKFSVNLHFIFTVYVQIYMSWNYLAYVDGGYRLRQRSCPHNNCLFCYAVNFKENNRVYRGSLHLRFSIAFATILANIYTR